MQNFELKEGRTKKIQYINTDFDFIDKLNEYANCETLGFYLSIKRYINRKNNVKENQITYTQKYLEKKLNIGHSKYYKHLKTLFNAGLIDMEKTAIVKFFINYNIEGKENPLVTKNILYFSTFEGVNIWLKGNLEKIIEEQYSIPKELINIVEITHRTSYILHDYPPIHIFKKNDFEFKEYREWDTEMDKFRKGGQMSKNDRKKDNEDPAFQNGKEGPFQNGKEGPFQNGKVNNIIQSSNNIIESKNIRINQSNKLDFDRLTDLDIQIKNKGFKSYKELIYELRLEDKSYFEYPALKWTSSIKKAIWEMYYFDNTTVYGKRVARFDVVCKLQKLDIEIIQSVISTIMKESESKKIQHPVAYLKTTIFNEIDEFEAKIQAQVNYDLNNM